MPRWVLFRIQDLYALHTPPLTKPPNHCAFRLLPDMDPRRLSAVVTGAAQGIGRTIAVKLAKDGLILAINDVASKADDVRRMVEDAVAARRMIKQGREGKIIGACSIAGKQGIPMISAYASIKFAVCRLTQSVDASYTATELGQFGINVNAYAPGVVPTDMMKTLAAGLVIGDAFLKSVR
ncbi:NAD-P-binding protein [Stereum hirsutum FP-91666 SS1]|uniref:NAD-P-binding protein n=1 Tax=Stereum hirsutum (strain FP-91666) TaxID=721885 RepID=UPI0004449B23|nr:NAD-P-binding protein [Stereum hirsutum FP-91666 SS1]EIM83174.1 NAD-P-binding protein [Stereum hirsutum FP-91666 SS1]